MTILGSCDGQKIWQYTIIWYICTKKLCMENIDRKQRTARAMGWIGLGFSVFTALVILLMCSMGFGEFNFRDTVDGNPVAGIFFMLAIMISVYGSLLSLILDIVAIVMCHSRAVSVKKPVIGLICMGVAWCMIPIALIVSMRNNKEEDITIQAGPLTYTHHGDGYEQVEEDSWSQPITIKLYKDGRLEYLDPENGDNPILMNYTRVAEYSVDVPYPELETIVEGLGNERQMSIETGNPIIIQAQQGTPSKYINGVYSSLERGGIFNYKLKLTAE